MGVVSRRWMWMESMGVASGVVVRRDNYRFPHNYYLSLLLLYLFFFAAASLLFSFFNVFCSLFNNYYY